MDKCRKAILLGGAEADTGAILDLLAGHVTMLCVSDLPELLRELETGDYDALFCDWSVGTGNCTYTWREVLKDVHKCYPGMPVIVVYHGADEQDWVDVLKAGAFELIIPPYSKQQVLGALEYAALSHRAKPMTVAA